MGPDVAWSVDALRGARARCAATTDVDAAALPFDQAEAGAAWRARGWTFASGFRAAAPRGGDLADVGAAGPVVALRRAGAALGAAACRAARRSKPDAFHEAAAGRLYPRAEQAACTSPTRAGPASARLPATSRIVGELQDGVGHFGGGRARRPADRRFPLARAYASAEPEDPWVHRTEPRVEVAALGTRADDALVIPTARGMTGPDGGAWLAAVAWDNAIGRWGTRTSAQIDASAGVVGDATQLRPVLRARASASEGWVGLRADFARVVAPSSAGGALLARARLGPSSGLNVALHVAGRDGVDPVLARALVDAPLEPASGWLASTGWTAGARVAVPLGSRVTARAGADEDLTAQRLVAALAALGVHDPCGCVVVRASAAHRIGRDGVDVWLPPWTCPVDPRAGTQVPNDVPQSRRRPGQD